MDEDLLARKMDVLIRIQAQLAVGGMESQKDKIIFLGQAGVSSREIAEIVGTSVGTVSVTLSVANKRRVQKKIGKPSKAKQGNTDDK